ncbi:MAG: hypothetical protein JXA68_01800 [Ignavibacteriales bacterium]|nr:hypothetical protein [Ignavibacteriales bacterium]
MSKKYVFHVISNTHWDREWRFPFQRTRQNLVDMIDETLRILKTEPRYRAFHLDSQSIVLKDYLEIRPHKVQEIKRFVKEGRLLIGPWYILPEEFQVGGENLIRNLLLGHKTCNQYGGVSKIGYSPFSWGQISQLPQIYDQFNIDVIMFYRGVNSLDSPKSEFLWEGADGTRKITSRFSTMPRYNFYFYIYRSMAHGTDVSILSYDWKNGGLPFHFADVKLHDEDYSIVEPLGKYFSENLEKQVNKLIDEQINDFNTEHIIWMEGHDSSGPNPITVRIIDDINKMNVGKVVHSTLVEYAEALKKSIKVEELKLVKGERRSAQFDRRSGNLFGYTTSARMDIKLKNFDAERWLQFFAEPFNSISGILGRDINDQYIDIAWEMLIQNSAHDSIGGCSLDAIHSEMMQRYNYIIQISKGVFDRSIKHIVKNINLEKFLKPTGNIGSEIYLVAFNTNFRTRNEIVEVIIDIPKELNKNSITIFDEEINKLEFQLINEEDEQPIVEQLLDRPLFFYMKRYRGYLNIKDIPAFGFKTFKVIPSNNLIQEKLKPLGKFSKRTLILENENIKIKVNNNGTFNVTMKDSKETFSNLGYFYDEGEAGHAWVNEPVKPFVTTMESNPKIRLIENGFLKVVCHIQHNISLPINLKFRRKNKFNKKIQINLYLILTKNSNRVDVKVEFENTTEEHRLRIMFPIGFEAKKSYGEGQFDVVERTTERINADDWIEKPMYDFPMHNFVDVNNGKKGFAILVDGLKEYEVIKDKKDILAITLIRAFTYRIVPSSPQEYLDNKGSQCIGKHSFNLSFYPHKENWNQGNVYLEAMNFNNTISMVQIGKPNGSLPPTTSFLKIEPSSLVFSCFKKSENWFKDNSYVLRIYNPNEIKIEGRISSYFEISKVCLITLEEKVLEEIHVLDKFSFNIKVLPKKILSYQITFN